MNNRVDRRREVITGETLHLALPDKSNDDPVACHVISECQLTDCRLLIEDSGRTSIFASTFKRCTFEVSRVYAESWRGCFIESCKFKGKFYNVLFGNESTQCSNQAGLRDCDFTETTLNLCVFLNCTPDDLRLPKWPNITIFNPGDNAEHFADLASDRVLWTIHSLMEGASPKKIALSFHIPSLIKQSRPGIIEGWEYQKQSTMSRGEPEPPEPVISLERIRELLKAKPYVFM